MNFKDYKIVTRGKVCWIAPKKHKGVYNCDMVITDAEGRKTVFKPLRSTKKYQSYRIVYSG